MDRRSKKTEEQILQATLRLLQHETMDELTITEICHEANISRSTFYLHYTEPRDIVESLYIDVAITLTNILDNFDLSTNQIKISELLDAIFEEIEMYKDYFVVLLTTGYHSNFRRRLKKILADKILNDNAYRFKNLKDLEYLVSFMISGLVECICDNIDDFLDENKKELLYNRLFKIISHILTVNL